MTAAATRQGTLALVGSLALSPASALAADKGPLALTITEGAYAASPGAPAIGPVKVYGTPGDDYAFDIAAFRDGFVVVGRTTSPAGDFDAAVLRLDAEGGLVWAKAFGGDKLDMAFAVRVLADETIAVAGWTQSFGAGEGDFHLLGLSPEGEIRFEKTFGGPGEERAVAMTVTRDGGLAILGESYGHGEGDSRFYLVRTDARGELLWERTYDGGPLHERGLAIVETGDGFLLAGNSMDSRSGSSATVSDGYAVRTDADGNEIWSRRYGGDAHDIFHHVAALDGDRFVFTGYTQGHDARGGSDLWFVVIDGAGETLHVATAGGDGADENVIARAAPGGGVYIAGYSHSDSAGGWDAQIGRLDAQGRVEHLHLYGAAGDDGAVSLVPLPDGGLAVAGYTRSFGAGGRDIAFFRIGPFDP